MYELTVYPLPVFRRVLIEAMLGPTASTPFALKENVIVGRLIPAGTGMPTYREIFLEKDEPPVVQPSLEDLLRPETEDEERTRCHSPISTTSSSRYDQCFNLRRPHGGPNFFHCGWR